MSRQIRLHALFAALFVAALAGGGQAQSADEPYVPQPGEIGKDVIWLPSENVMVQRMLDIAQVTAKDFVVDLGSGDGRTVIAAARRGARALGVEHNPQLVEYSRRMAQKARVGARAQFVQGDLFEADLSQATVITLFLLEEINLKLRPKLLGLKPGTRIVSNSFDMSGWTADRMATVSAGEGCTSYCDVYLWIVPVKVGGIWRLGTGELAIEQRFQMITGTLKTGGKATPVKGRVTGDQVSFKAGDAEYRGRVGADGIRGTVKARNKTGEWRATRGG
jgi:SAM-dependent methyltransferase